MPEAVGRSNYKPVLNKLKQSGHAGDEQHPIMMEATGPPTGFT